MCRMQESQGQSQGWERGGGSLCCMQQNQEGEEYRGRTVTKKLLVPLENTAHDGQKPECQGLGGEGGGVEPVGTDSSFQTSGINRSDGEVSKESKSR